jgi:hypothetical protein
MTQEEYKDHYVGLIKNDDSIKVADPEGHVSRAIQMGLEEFWASDNWSFKRFATTLTLTATESQNLPSTMESFEGMREEETVTGRKLTYYPKAEFDLLVPKLSHHPSGNPQACTVYYEYDEERWKFKAFPIPEGGEVVYIDAFRKAPDSVANVPPTGHACLDAYIAKHVYPRGHWGYVAAIKDIEREYKQLQRIDRANCSRTIRFSDGTDRQVISQRPWV